MQNKLIIFDCDGVLVDSEYIAGIVLREALEGYGYEITVEESIKRFAGVNGEVARQMIQKEAQIEIPENYWELVVPKLHEVFETKLNALMLPVLKILEDLKIKRCVASNNVRECVLSSLKFSNQVHYFEESSIFTASQVGKPKPAPDLYLYAANQMGFSPKDCIVIEDSAAGMHAARAAGMEVFIFLGGTHASYDWYQDKFSGYDHPVLFSCDELIEAMKLKTANL